MGLNASPRMSWREICAHSQFRGRWIAIDDCRYEESDDHPVEGTVIDADDDLAELCSRMKTSHRRCCAIMFCEALEARRHDRSSLHH